MKESVYVVWIEGLTLRTGEKIKAIKEGGFEYTTLMTKALRVKESDIPAFKALMEEREIADWAINSDNTFCKTSYTPKGTLWK